MGYGLHEARATQISVTWWGSFSMGTFSFGLGFLQYFAWDWEYRGTIIYTFTATNVCTAIAYPATYLEDLSIGPPIEVDSTTMFHTLVPDPATHQRNQNAITRGFIPTWLWLLDNLTSEEEFMVTWSLTHLKGWAVICFSQVQGYQNNNWDKSQIISMKTFGSV